ncbi:hypothetical protein TSAR_014727 [Trichomalopsis sarcophagae]|uniref:Uncharacterized protein n=1 Tax=Trichomalopsis sarcophagae TaxID=543379 RepID=A0A232FFT3_9HYME|nr:hypothetical protein TSAR_014727 [Trichomalopsis sarcophagae]
MVRAREKVKRSEEVKEKRDIRVRVYGRVKEKKRTCVYG